MAHKALEIGQVVLGYAIIAVLALFVTWWNEGRNQR